MVTILGSSDACTTTVGSGLATVWTLSGATTAYTGSLATDGYKLKAAMTFKNGGATAVSGDTINVGNAIGIGTCVATLDAAGSAPTTTDATVGNFAICHFVFYLASATGGNSGTITDAWTGTHWGVTKYLTSTQWGATAAAGIIGSSMNTATGGTALTAANNGLVFDPATKPSAGFVETTAYSMEWYQPTYKTSYTASELRRYGGGYNNSTADKVKGYCISQRLTATTTHLSAGITAGSAVTLSGASALAAGAIAFGVAALAI